MSGTLEQRLIIALHAAIGRERDGMLADPWWEGDRQAAEVRARMALRQAVDTVVPPGPDTRSYLVWSNEHRQWWRPAKGGYTDSLDEAGRYSREAAERIVATATCDGLLTYRRADPVSGEEYSQVSEAVVLAPEDIPPSEAR